MFTVPIDNTGLASFVPVRRQEGQSVGTDDNQELNIFGQLAGLPRLEIARQKIEAGQIPQQNTGIGSLRAPDELAPGIRSSGGRRQLSPPPRPPSTPTADTVEAPATTTDSIVGPFAPRYIGERGDTGLLNKIGDKISEATSRDAFGVDFGEGTFTAFGKKRNIKNTLISKVVNSTLNQAAIQAGNKFLGAAVPGIGRFLTDKITGRESDAADYGFDVATGIAALVAPPLVPLIFIANLARDFFDDDDSDRFSDPDVGLGISGTESSFFFGDTTVDPAFDTLNFDMEPITKADLDAFEKALAGGSSSGGGRGSDIGAGFGGIGGRTGADDTSDSPSFTARERASQSRSRRGSSRSRGSSGGFGSSAGSACWIAGTQILMADNTYQNIEDLKVGDMIMSYPEDQATRRWNTPLEAKPIISLLVDISSVIWHLNDSMVSATEWIIKGDGTAAVVQWLNVGDTILGADGELIEVTRVEPAQGKLKNQVVYNLETKDNYTYTANNIRTLRGRAVRGEWLGEDYKLGNNNAYEGSMKDEYNRKFKQIAA
jgi:hypothetical protein